VTGLSTEKPSFNPRPVHVGFIEDKAAMGQLFTEYFGSPGSTIPPMLCNHPPVTSST
jgi:hypothetical protein